MGLCASSPPAISEDGVDLSHFERLRVVGRGAFGKVHAVRDRRTGALFAMKCMYKHEVIERRHGRVVWRERDVLVRLHEATDCAFLVRVRCAFQTESELFLVLDFLQGGDLRYQLGRNGRLTEAAARFYAVEMLLGLEALHEAGFVHRDLKPDNVMLDDEGHVKLTDFGLCKELRPPTFQHRGFAGTAGYAAPEVEADELYGFAADFFSLGVCVYELLHDRRPLYAAEKKLPEASAFRGDLSEECFDLLMGLLEPHPEERLHHWDDVKAHAWFRDVDWERARQRGLDPPFEPAKGVANCSAVFEAEDQLLTDHTRHRRITLTSDEQVSFEGWEFNTTLREDDDDDDDDDDANNLDVSRRLSGVGVIDSESPVKALAATRQQQDNNFV